jgi:hypothetical protein
LVCSLRAKLLSDLPTAVDELREVLTSPAFSVANSAKLKLDTIALAIMNDLQAHAAGAPASAAALLSDPISVVTAIKASGPAGCRSVVDQGDVHRALQGLATCSPTWRIDALPPLAGCTFRRTIAPPDHLVYARKRSRVVWFPTHFNGGKLTRLGCYHTNQTLAGLQTEALLTATSALALLERTGQWSPPQREQAQLVAGLLGRLHSGKATYRSESVKLLLDSDARKADVNELRRYFGLPVI